MWIIAGALCLCGLLFWGMNTAGKPDGSMIEIYVAGELVRTLPAFPETPEELWIEGQPGQILLRTEPDGVSVISADCPSRDCVHTGKISAPGQMIACLPNRILIRLTGAGTSEVDAVAR